MLDLRDLLDLYMVILSGFDEIQDKSASRWCRKNFAGESRIGGHSDSNDLY